MPDIIANMLYGEDNPDNLKLMEHIVEFVPGLAMISSHNAEMGIELAKSEKPDVIILDINLPGVQTHSNNILWFGPYIVESSVIQPSKFATLFATLNVTNFESITLDAGFKQYLTKPIIIDEVLKAIKDALNKNENHSRPSSK